MTAKSMLMSPQGLRPGARAPACPGLLCPLTAHESYWPPTVRGSVPRPYVVIPVH